jgi:hypothetical protein
MKKSLKSESAFQSLGADFAAFRAGCRSHARIPEHLRGTLFKAVASGMAPAFFKKKFGVTTGQFSAWRQSRQRPAPDSPRALDVIRPVLGAVPTGLRVPCEAGRLLLKLSF